jgi:3-methyladenine DNA glycosylase AlkD
LYLQNNYTKAKDNVQKAEIAWALTQAGKYVNLNFSTV